MLWKMIWINFSTYYRKNRTSILTGMLILLFYGCFLHACSLAYERFGILNFTQNMYQIFGSFSSLSCIAILTLQGRRSTYILLPVCLSFFLLTDIVVRLLLSALEIQPGIYREYIDWLGAVVVLLVRTVFVAVLLAVLYFRPKFKPAFYFVVVCFLAAAAFYLSAIQVPLVLAENIHSHKVQQVATRCVRTYACNDDSSFFLDPPATDENPAPFQSRIIRNADSPLVFDGWDGSSVLRGFYCDVSKNDFRFVLETASADGDMARLRLLQYLDDQVAYETIYECLICMVPSASKNCLSPDGSLVALNNCNLMNFFDTSTFVSPFEASPDPEYLFVEWTTSGEGQPLFYYRTGNRALLIDTQTGEPTASRTLSFRAPVISSLTLSPDGERLLYAGEFTDCFFLDSMGEGRDSVLHVGRAEGYMGCPFWLNDRHFVYISSSLTLNEVDTQTRSLGKITQAFELVQWLDYEPRAHRLVWTTQRMGRESTIHAYTLTQGEGVMR